MIPEKSRSPFYPGQPVPIEYFSGRTEIIVKMERVINQVSHGKPQSVFISGEYGIGKTSLANYIRFISEEKFKLFGIHLLCGGVNNLNDLSVKLGDSIIKSGYKKNALGKVRDMLAKYIGEQELFGIKIHLDKLKEDSEQISKNILPFLVDLFKRLSSGNDNFNGILLILDEINGIANNPDFAYFIKSFVDENAISLNPLPILLILCGIEERRKQLIHIHQPIERIFDIIEVNPMESNEVETFYINAFKSVGISIDKKALSMLTYYSGGYPKLMHIIGDNVFWIDKDNSISEDDVLLGVVNAANEFGRKFIDSQVFDALKSKNYQSILKKLTKELVSSAEFVFFIKSDIEKLLTEPEKKTFHNFLQKMKKLNVLKEGSIRGEYAFNNKMIVMYIYMSTVKSS
ncbi:MAG: hypothetical protein A2Y33_09635 [Spirochaetes bacterium GWF1_51_8]|nr:MAG: hypothetical protein A2Y33_09635 [Spirochaetes bacterium GWF1_51_8]